MVAASLRGGVVTCASSGNRAEGCAALLLRPGTWGPCVCLTHPGSCWARSWFFLDRPGLKRVLLWDALLAAEEAVVLG